MGNFGKYRHRGSARFAGLLVPPGQPDWSLEVVSSTELRLHWSGALPPNMLRIWVDKSSTGPPTWDGPLPFNANPILFAGLDPNHQYWFRVYWGSATDPQTEWSDTKTATTIP
jgi:hypothetical protein